MRSSLVCHPVIGLKKDSGSGAETSAGRSLTTIQSNLGTESVHARQRPTGSRGSDCEQRQNGRMNVCGKERRNQSARKEEAEAKQRSSQSAQLRLNSRATSPSPRNRIKRQLEKIQICLSLKIQRERKLKQTATCSLCGSQGPPSKTARVLHN